MSFDDPARCSDPNLVWRSGTKTMYESYPEPGSKECIEFNGCKWEGLFSACQGKRTEQWVSARNIVAVFPDFDGLELHDLCVRGPDGQLIVATVYDQCGDHDCNGCCTRNRGKADALIDLESFTNERFGVKDGPLQWADLGIKGASCAD